MLVFVILSLGISVEQNNYTHPVSSRQDECTAEDYSLPFRTQSIHFITVIDILILYTDIWPTVELCLEGLFKRSAAGEKQEDEQGGLHVVIV